MSTIRIAVLIGVVISNTAWAGDHLGRLFLTPEQRQVLDEQRGPNAQSLTNQDHNALMAGRPDERRILVNGAVSRSAGPDVVWVNGNRAGTDRNPSVQLRRGPDQGNRVTLEDATGKRVRLKPGQFWDRATGRVANCFGCETGSASTPAAAADPAPAPATATEP